MMHSIIYTIVLLTFFGGAILVYIFLNKADKKELTTDDIIEYDEIAKDTNTGKTFFEKLKLKNNRFVFEPNDTVRGILAIVCYVVIFFILASVISEIVQALYCKENGLDPQILIKSSDIYSPEEYEKMNIICSPYTNFFTYVLGIISIVAISFKYLKKDLKAFKKGLVPIIFIGLGFVYAGSITSSYLIKLLGIESNASNEAALRLMFTGPTLGVIALASTSVILAPIVEELVFRKAIFNLCKNDTRKGILLSCIFFGLIHVFNFIVAAGTNLILGKGTYLTFISEFIFIIGYSLMGLGIAIAYVKSNRNIVVTIILHMINNFISVILTLLMIYANVNLPIS